jgi:2-polyprenyl-3-methyl-5-hydroxy-6-metoxy-1,4-benzoquinol methylase
LDVPYNVAVAIVKHARAHAAAARTATEAAAITRYFEGLLAACIRVIDGWGRAPRVRPAPQRDAARGVRRRTDAVAWLLERHGVAGMRVVDLGCGTGEVAFAAARLGANVLAIDAVEPLVRAASNAAASAGMASRVQCRQDDMTTMQPEPSDVTMLVGVVEYYSDLDGLLRHALARTRQLAIVVDTRGPLWRRTLRRAIARFEGFTLIYRSPRVVVEAMERCGFTAAERLEGHSFTAMAFQRRGEDA